MEEESTNTLQSIFAGIEDLRVERTKRHKLLSTFEQILRHEICSSNAHNAEKVS